MTAATTLPRTMTLEEWAELDEDEPGELVDGQLVEEEIRYYWLVSPELRTIEILELGADGRYVHVQNIASGRVDVAGCEGLVLDADDLWREVERVETEEG